MAALDFPNSPTLNQQYAAPNGVTYQWDSAAWVVTGGPPGQLWTGAGATLTPTDQTKTVTIPATADSNPLIFGRRTIKSRHVSHPTADAHYWSANDALNTAGTAWTQDDATKPSWVLDCDVAGDAFGVWHAPAAGTLGALLTVRGSDGRTVANLADQSITWNQITTGHSIHGAVTATIPSFSSATQNAWLKLVDLPALAPRGGLVHVTAWIGGQIFANPTGGNLYLGVFKNGTNAIQVSISIKSGGTGNTQYPIPTVSWWEQSAAAASMVYSIYVFQGTNTGLVSNGDGFAAAAEYA